jgi:hypothetical protein
VPVLGGLAHPVSNDVEHRRHCLVLVDREGDGPGFGPERLDQANASRDRRLTTRFATTCVTSLPDRAGLGGAVGVAGHRCAPSDGRPALNTLARLPRSRTEGRFTVTGAPTAIRRFRRSIRVRLAQARSRRRSAWDSAAVADTAAPEGGARFRRLDRRMLCGCARCSIRPSGC